MAEFTRHEIYMLLNQKQQGLWLAGIDLSGADLMAANLGWANLRRADLNNANIGGAFLKGADLWGANLREANLMGANLQQANFKGTFGLETAKLQQAIYDEYTKWPDGFNLDASGVVYQEDFT